MRLLFECGSTRIGGAEKFLCRLARHLRPLLPGWKFDALVLFERGGLTEEFKRSFGQVYYLRDTSFSLTQFLKWHKTDILHAVDSHQRIATEAGCLPGVAIVQNVFPQLPESKYAPESEWFAEGWKRCAAIATETILNEQYMSGAGIGNLHRIPNGIDTSFWTPAPVEKKYDVIWCGRAERMKGIELAIDLMQATPWLSWCFVLNEPTEPYYSRLKGCHDIDCYSSASHESLRILFRQSTIYLHTSAREGMPGTLLEAMACGCIPAASNVGGIPDVLDGIGTLIDLEQPGALGAYRAALREIMTSTASKKIEATPQALHRVEESFSIENTVKSYAEIYQSIARAA